MISSCDAPFYVNPIIGPQAEAEGMCNLVNPVLNRDLRAGARVSPSCHFYLEVNVEASRFVYFWTRSGQPHDR